MRHVDVFDEVRNLAVLNKRIQSKLKLAARNKPISCFRCKTRHECNTFLCIAERACSQVHSAQLLHPKSATRVVHFAAIQNIKKQIQFFPMQQAALSSRSWNDQAWSKKWRWQNLSYKSYIPDSANPAWFLRLIEILALVPSSKISDSQGEVNSPFPVLYLLILLAAACAHTLN
jgi:hypothetical protein